MAEINCKLPSKSHIEMNPMTVHITVINIKGIERA